MRTAGAVLAALVVLFTGCSRDPELVKRRYVETGNKYFERGKYREASIMYRSALRKDARYGEAYYRLGLTYLKTGELQQAVGALRRAVELQPDNDDARARLADLYVMAYLSDGRRPRQLYEDIRELALGMLRRNPNSYEGLRLMGYLAWTDRDLKLAIDYFSRANKVKPHQPDLILALCQALAEADRLAEAEQLAKELIARQKDYAPIYEALYLQYVRRNRAEDAEAIRRLKLENMPDRAQPYVELAQHYFAVGRKEEATRTLDRLIARSASIPQAWREAGDACTRFNEFDKALAYYREGLAKGPAADKLSYQRRIAEVMVAQNRKEEAARYLDQLLKEHPNNAELEALHAAVLLDLGGAQRVETAVKKLQAAVGRNPNDAALRFYLGRAHQIQGNVDVAQTQFREALRVRADYLPARLALAQIHLDRKEWAAALQQANEILARAPNHLAGGLIRASALAGSGDRDQARQQLQELLRLYPGSRDVLLQLGRVEYQSQRLAEAEKAFEQCYRARPEDLECFLGLVETYAAQRQFARALQALRQQQARQPDQPRLWLAEANVLVLSGDYQAAAPIYERLVKREPNVAEHYLRLGEVWRQLQKLDLALEHFRKARDLRPREASFHYPFALLLHTMGRAAEARGIYEQILKLEPDSPVALNNLAYVIAESGGDLDLALTYAQRARQRLPNSDDVADTIGWIYVKKNLSANAIAIYEQLIARQPNNPTFRYHYAVALLQKGDKARARQELLAALRNRPSKEEEGRIRELMGRIG
ncbi:MAG: tetratricopeptide repeat protein [Bryobacterales bacterium]|nr:tetratricopeptide repeat protein [Bryobacteraceae bacterium]MDW8353552.1 tetratricopeptide repeat protein [Bryobacterales bacterium]